MEIMVLGSLLMTAAAAILCLFVCKKLRKSGRNNNNKSRRSSSSSRLPLGSLGIWPFVGETLHFISSAYSDRPEAFMDKRRRMYGKVFKSHLFGSATIVSTDAEVSRIILQSDAKTFIPSYPKSLMELMGKSSILVINGSLQRRIHGLIASFLKSPTLRSQITTDMRKYVIESMANWSQHAPVYIQDEAKHIAFQVLVKALISLDGGDELELLKKHFQQFIAGLMSLPFNFPGTQLYRSLQGIWSSDGAAKDVADVLVKDTSEELTDDLIAENLIDLMIPGEDSVPLLITLAIKYLSDSPPALKQFTEENLQLKRVKEKLGEPLSWDDYLSLRFTQTVITETLRMGKHNNRGDEKSSEGCGNKGAFDPKGMDKEISNCNFTPFGGGQRLCPGLDLARLEASIFLHHFVTQFR
ncbi:3-epi-6-deoxocathasterone 23-monooxygenase CYP90D1 [Sesamum angolense]|uniref:3-epi-6-deoxocathasterone 23-monooxygenase CYP90D1 n=1 Tax=Sesamum angolense TaxID=2727404 RepID=A0AAE1WL34_9LAMI|nr:3-epi-6-deoxocathasterone 23-monooxygenase CYP90D1 [Sesamum angolense]